jgi:hypothetical protein
MKHPSNLAQFPTPKDGDGGDDGDIGSFQLLIDVADNGFILNSVGSEYDGTRVFLFDGKGQDGPQAMIQEIINRLGINDKVKIQK